MKSRLREFWPRPWQARAGDGADAALERPEARVDDLVGATFEGRRGRHFFGGRAGGGRPGGGTSFWGAAA